MLDIENSLVSKVEVRNPHELEELRESADYLKSYIEVKTTDDSVVNVYKVRPYTFDFLRALEPFFKIILFSNLSDKVIN